MRNVQYISSEVSLGVGLYPKHGFIIIAVAVKVFQRHLRLANPPKTTDSDACVNAIGAPFDRA